MKRIASIITLLLLFLVACNESSTTFFSLYKEGFTAASKDSLVILVETEGPDIELTGDLWLTGGKCQVSMSCPILDTVFKNVYTLVRDTVTSDTTYFEDVIERIDSVFMADTLYGFDTIWGVQQIDTFNIDSIYVSDTIFSIDTLLTKRILYQELFSTADKYKIDQKFGRIKGTWIFKYSLEKIDTEYPSGDLNFNIKYED